MEGTVELIPRYIAVAAGTHGKGASMKEILSQNCLGVCLAW